MKISVRATRYSLGLEVEGEKIKWRDLKLNRKQEIIIHKLMKHAISKHASLRPRCGRGFIAGELDNNDKEKLYKTLNKKQKEHLVAVEILEKL